MNTCIPTHNLIHTYMNIEYIHTIRYACSHIPNTRTYISHIQLHFTHTITLHPYIIVTYINAYIHTYCVCLQMQKNFN